jgi:hypothetical protein
VILLGLNIEEYLTGSFSIVIAVIFLIVGGIICLKYFKIKNKIFILVGLSWIGLAFPWVSVSVLFLTIILLNAQLNEGIFFFIIIGIVPFTQICWLMAISNFMSVRKKIKNILLIVALILAITIESFFIYILFTNVSFIGRIEGLEVKFTLISQVYLIIMVAIFEIIGFVFVRESLKSDNPEIRLKGKFLFLAFLSFIFGAMAETVIMALTIVVIGRIILIFSAFAYYCGFMLPRWMKELFIKESKNE